jgi:hypothetical protein
MPTIQDEYARVSTAVYVLFLWTVSSCGQQSLTVRTSPQQKLRRLQLPISVHRPGLEVGH